ncbi:MAG: tRNA (N6-isopentenyl adenosine(37)-C2)-methylthiotransferase MiaB [Anaerolineae bacterium]
MKYYIWTIGCQMNVADSQRLASELERLGYQAADRPEAADVIVLNTCVVRQSAEDRAYGRLWSLKPLKERRPETVIGLMGCLVGQRDPAPLREHFPFVDVFLPPSEHQELITFLDSRALDRAAREIEREALRERYRIQDGGFLLPSTDRGQLVSCPVPVIYGCNHVCTFCIIPSRRGRERSRPLAEIVAEVEGLVAQGVREVTLLGQIVDRYGYDLPDGLRLADLLRALHDIEGLWRIRFLTSHPNYMTDELLDAVAELPKVCEHIEVPVQAGHDEVLRRMKRGYTVDDYRRLIARIQERVPGASIATDIIVGFPGETEEQFMSTYNLLRELELDVAHVAMYSPRPGTVAAKIMEDDVPLEEKQRRRKALDELQAEIVGRINRRLVGQTVEVLVEEKHKGKWKGRTRTNKLVFFEDEHDWLGRLARVKITWAGPWSMQGEVQL